MSEVKVLIKNI